MSQFAILVLQRDTATGLLRRGIVLEQPVEADTPEAAIAASQWRENPTILLDGYPECAAEVIARRAVFERNIASGKVIFSQDRRHYLTTEQVQETTWFQILRSARQRTTCTIDPNRAGTGVDALRLPAETLQAIRKEVL